MPAADTPETPLSRYATAVSARLRELLSWLPLSLALVLSPGLFLWPLFHRERLGYVLDNRLPAGDRSSFALALLASLLVSGAGYAALVARRRRLDRAGSIAASCAALNRPLIGILALPLLPPLALPGFESEAPFIALLLIALIAALIGASVYRLPWRLPWRLPLATPLARRRTTALGLTLAIAIAQGVYFAALCLLRHHAFETRVYDLGIYDNILWHSSHGMPLASSFVRGGTHFSAHVDPLLLFLVPLYRVWPHAGTLLSFQALWLALGAVPLFLLADAVLDAPLFALVLACAYLLHPALHGACLFDFHSLTLAIPLVLWALCALERNQPRLFAVAIGLLLLAREDAAFLVASIGLASIVTGKRSIFGLAPLLTALAYFAAIKLFVMPAHSLFMQDSANSYSYESFYSDLIPIEGQGARGLLLSLVTNPTFVLAHMLTPAKLQLLLLLFLPTLGLAFAAGAECVLLVYGLAFTLLSSRPAVHQIGFQYVAVILPFVFSLVPTALRRLRMHAPSDAAPENLLRALGAALLVASLLVSWKFGAIVPNTSFRAGGRLLVRATDPSTLATGSVLVRALEQIPAEASLLVGDRLGPHVSNRPRVARFLAGRTADYLLVEPLLLEPPDRAYLDQLLGDGHHQVLLESAGVLLVAGSRP